MELSPGIEIVWSLAAEEMKAAQCKEIEPDHFFCALLKLSELSASDLSALGIPAAVLTALQSEIDQIKKVLNDRAIPSQNTRHEILKVTPKGSTPFQGDVIHRSSASRRVFEEAARRGSLVKAPDLLQALLNQPTPAMLKVLKLKPEAAPAPVAAPSGLAKLYAAVAKPLEVDGMDALSPAVEPQIDVLAWSLQNRPAIGLVCAPGVNVDELMDRAAERAQIPGKLISVDGRKLLFSLRDPDTLPDVLAGFAALAAENEGSRLVIDTGNYPSSIQVERILQAVSTCLEKESLSLVVAIREESYRHSAVAQSLNGALRVIWLYKLTEYQTPIQV
jgi:hypothetical protein